MFKQILWITAVFILLISTFAQAKIVFTSSRDGNREIYVMNDDGTRVQRLTHNKFRDKNPTWSPDGKQIAFTRASNAGFGNSQYDIFIMDADGSNQQNLTKHPARDDDASWSPDGRHITFTSSRSGTNEIHIVDIFSSEVKQLTHNKGNNAFGIKGIIADGGFPIDGFAHEPCWSPDGKYIVYNHYGLGQAGTINIIDVKTKQTKQLIQPKPHLSVNSPRWSPNGKYILYHETNSEAAVANVNPNKPNFIDDFIRLLTRRFVIVSVEGVEQAKLAIPEEWAIASQTSWSPDSKEFVFSASSQRRGLWDIYRYNLATHEIINLTNNIDYNISPNWFNHALSISPVGKMATQWGEIKK